ncbi:MAG: GDP-mannose 4,6-dehydratase, partial [Dehalococcoidia bacterium]
RVEFVEVDVTDPAFRSIAAQPFDEIYHLACPTGVPNLGPLAREMLRTCYTGSEAVLEAARSNGAAVLLTSTAEVYGNPEVAPQSEDYTGNVDTLGPRKGYEEGKRVAETLFGIYAERYGIQAKVVRIFNTYGPGMSLSDTRIVPAFVRAAIEHRPLVMHGDGQQTRCHCFVSDMIAGLRLAMQHARPGRAYNLGSQTQTSVRTLAELIVQLTDSDSPIVSVERPGHDHDNRLPDTSRARTELGWSQHMDLESGLLQTITDFQARLGTTQIPAYARG